MKKLRSFILSMPVVILATSSNAQDYLEMAVSTPTLENPAGEVSNARMRVTLQNPDGIDLSNYECFQLIAEDARTGAYWVQATPRMRRGQLTMDWVVSSFSSFPLFFYFVGGTNEHCADFRKVLPPNAAVPLSDSYFDIIEDNRVTRVCEFIDFRDLEMRWLGTQGEVGCG